MTFFETIKILDYGRPVRTRLPRAPKEFKIFIERQAKSPWSPNEQCVALECTVEGIVSLVETQ
jgi:hypothetical protein